MSLTLQHRIKDFSPCVLISRTEGNVILLYISIFLLFSEMQLHSNLKQFYILMKCSFVEEYDNSGNPKLIHCILVLVNCPELFSVQGEA